MAAKATTARFQAAGKGNADSGGNNQDEGGKKTGAHATQATPTIKIEEFDPAVLVDSEMF